MKIKNLLKTLNFLQYFVWGAWLITIASYFFSLNWTPSQFGIIYSTIGISAIGFPSFFGFLTDKYFKLEEVFKRLHLLSGLVMFTFPFINSVSVFFWLMLLYMILYMSTIPMLISYSYQSLIENGLDVKLEYPKIRVWGTIGFVAALWVVSLTNNETSVNQFYISGVASIALFVFGFFIPNTETKAASSKQNFLKVLGLDTLSLLTNNKLYPFFILCFFFGIALIISNGYTDAFIHDLKETKNISKYIFQYPAIIVSFSQICEIFFILLMPFLLKRFSTKTIIIISFFAWFLRFFLLYIFSYSGIFFIILSSCMFYGIAFDFFIIAGSLYLEENSNKEMRGSVQGMFVMVVNGFGSLFGSLASGFLIENYFTNANTTKDWKSIWLFFAVLMLIIVFPYLFIGLKNMRFKNFKQVNKVL